MHLRLFSVAVLSSILLFSCKKNAIQHSETAAQTDTEILQAESSIPGYTTYLIRQGQHFCSPRPLKSVSLTEMRFFAQFDQSAIYQTVDPSNQFAINKLWGFSEGFNNQYNSARIGWAYNNGALRLYGYVYCRGVRHSAEITTVSPFEEITCSIRVAGSNYVISANGNSVTLPRGTTASRASGYQQYPYFGGTETAPHDISIYIKPR